MDWKTIYEDLKATNWIILLILSTISYFLLTPAQTLGTILGGFLIIANFKFLQHTIQKAFSSEGPLKTGRKSIIAKYYCRLTILGIILYVLISKVGVDPIGLAIGLSTLVISISALGVIMFVKTVSEEAP